MCVSLTTSAIELKLMTDLAHGFGNANDRRFQALMRKIRISTEANDLHKQCSDVVFIDVFGNSQTELQADGRAFCFGQFTVRSPSGRSTLKRGHDLPHIAVIVDLELAECHADPIVDDLHRLYIRPEYPV